MDRANRLLERLYDAGGYVLPEELCRSAGVAIAELEMLLGLLRARGHRVEWHEGQGVRLPPPVHLDGHLIERGLRTDRLGRSVVVFHEVSSTNDVALDAVRGGDADGLVVLAEFQRAGRGRHGRSWVSPPNASVLMSTVLLDPDAALPLEAVTVAAGLAVAEGLDDLTGLSCRLRWPNDVMLDGAKVAGVLVEVSTRRSLRCVVVGAGINVASAPPAGEVDTRATCLVEHLGDPPDRVSVVQGVLRRLDAWIGAVEAGRLEELRRLWVSRCGMINERIRVAWDGRQFVGRVLDVSPMEGLVLQADTGQRLHLPAKGSTVLAG